MNIYRMSIKTTIVFLLYAHLSACVADTATVDSVSLSTDLSKRMLYSEKGPDVINFEPCGSTPTPELFRKSTKDISCAKLQFGDTLIREGKDCENTYCDTYFTFNEEGIAGANISTVRKIGKIRGRLVRDDLSRSAFPSGCYKSEPSYKTFSELISINDGYSWLVDYGWNYMADLEGAQCAPVVLARSLTVERK